jgi:4-hydroxy-tetrahydrodipicolinate reductase
VQYGLGPIGIAAARLVLEKKALRLVGGIDIDAAKAGREFGDVLNLQRKLNALVSDDAERVLAETKPDVVLHSTASFLNRIEDHLQTCCRAKASVVSSCEEMFYPFRRDAGFSKRIDGLAKKYGVALMATGVNPGFSMDVLPLAMSSVCSRVEKVFATRIVDASKRRLPLQKKIGAGLQPDEFRQLVSEGKLGHIGLVESLHAVADRLELEMDEVKESIDPKIADSTIRSPFLEVRPGEVAGILHVASGLRGGDEIVKLELQMYVGAENPVDRVRIVGEPPIEINVAGGIFGDTATIARMVNAIPIVQRAPAGFYTAMDLPMPFCVT